MFNGFVSAGCDVLYEACSVVENTDWFRIVVAATMCIVFVAAWRWSR